MSNFSRQALAFVLATAILAVAHHFGIHDNWNWDFNPKEVPWILGLVAAYILYQIYWYWKHPEPQKTRGIWWWRNPK
jgi:hypothetical protein